jgi:hypothetical protein
MIAYFVHNQVSGSDTIVIPEMNCAVPVDAEIVKAFISAAPNFASWSGNSCQAVDPQDFGTVIATRDEQGDVCVLQADLWHQRRELHLQDIV